VQHFDVVVVGSEISGLVAGALLAKGGMRVLHLDAAPWQSTYKFQDLTFYRQLRLFSTWDASPSQKRAFFDLNLITDMSKRLTPLQPSFQLVLPQQRLDITSDPQALAVELDREFPGSAQFLEEALRKVEETNDRLDKLLDGHLMLPPESWKERRELTRMMEENPLPEENALFDGVPADHPLRRVAEMPVPFITHLDPGASCPIRLARAARQIQLGLCELPGGMDELKERLSGVIKHFHGDARQEGIAEVSVSWGRIKSFRLSGGEQIGCEQVIGAEPVGKLAELLAEKSLGKWHEQVAAELRPAKRVYTLNLAVKADGIPEGMGPVGFVVRDLAAPLAGANLLLWWLHGTTGGLRALTLAALVPEPEGQGAASWRALKADVLGAVENLMPFYTKHLVHVDVPWDDGESKGATVRPVSEMAELYAWGGKSALGIDAVPYRTPLKNLTLANRQILPALGLEGEFLAGAVAARLLHNPRDKRSWFDL
jgi:hypothetical protein